MALFLVTQVSAMAPNLTLTSDGSGNVQISVYADANASVILDYYSGGQLLGAGVVGYTNYSGYFSGTINSYQLNNIPSGAQVMVVVNGQQSATTIWPSTGYNNNNNNNCYQYPYNCNNNGYGNGQVSLSQSNVNLTVGQSQNVSIYNTYNTGNYPNYNTNQYYVSNTSNGIVSATISGNTVTLYGQSNGSSSITICSGVNTYGNNASGCAAIYVTVTGYYNNGNNNYCYQTYPYNCNNNNYNNTCYQYPYNCNNNNYSSSLSVSNSTVQVTVGNSGVVSLYGNNNVYQYNTGYNYGNNNNGYYVTSNNSGVATATVNGSTLTIYGTNAGNTSVTVCSTNGNQCATVYVTVIAPVYTYPNYPVYNGQYNYTDPYTYPTQPGNWYYSYPQHCWTRR